MDSKQYFQFTLGPVQGFVAQARRTRDFWAGSFILSWLSATAMACIEKQGGKVEFPQPDEGYMRWLYGRPEADDLAPAQGCIPNRFKALTAEVPAAFNPQLVQTTIDAAWRAMAEKVWQADLAAIASPLTREIWDRQINRFWEVSWVMSAEGPSNLLDRRKNWRSQVSPPEPGHKCMMMDGWQELSGITRTDLGAVNRFWQQVSKQGKNGMQTDLREGEHLCALAFIKRRFARYFDQVNFAMPGELGTLRGWPVPTAVPSVAFLAAAPWLSQVIDKASIAAFDAFHAQAQALSPGYAEAAHIYGTVSDIRSVKCAAEERAADGFKRRWAGIDGQLYFPSSLQNPNLFPDQAQAGKVLSTLNKLKQSAGMAALPSPYYAILLMDGDQLGKHMGIVERQQSISQALNLFTNQAGDIVREHDGFLVYAGGDDVLALLPMEQALPAAAALQASYRKAFAIHASMVASSLSGAIEYVHIRTPLTRVLQDAHQLLDEVAKEETGRDAIAVRVWKPSGLALQWSMPWSKALDADGSVKMVGLASAFATQDEEGSFSNKFFFRIEQIIERFPCMPAVQLGKVLLTEYLHSFGARGSHLPTAELAGLLDQCQRWKRNPSGVVEPAQGNSMNPDGALLMRFLANKGLEAESA